MKRIISLLITLLTVVLCFAGCDSAEQEPASSKAESQNNTSSAAGENLSSENPSSEGQATTSTETPSVKPNSSSSKPPVTAQSSSKVNEPVLSERDKVYQGKDPAISSLSVHNKGNTARIASLMKKAEKGGSYTIAVLGGSISQGAGASDPESCYGFLVKEWWEKNFPKAKFTFVNAGIGGTNSEMGVYRMQEDLLKYKPDFVVVDYAVNHFAETNQYATYSTILYNILKQSNNPAVMSIYFTSCDSQKYKAGIYKKSADFPFDEMNKANNEQGVPAISYHNYIWNKINSGVIAWYNIGADYIHPSDNGHKIAANLIGNYLEGVKSSLKTASTKITAPKKPDKTDYLNLGYATNSSSEIISATGMSKCDNSKPYLKGWILSAGKTGEIKVKLPANAKGYLFCSFGSGRGQVEVTGASGKLTYTQTDANSPRLLSVASAGNEFTIKASVTSGTFTIYGIAYRK